MKAGRTIDNQLENIQGELSNIRIRLEALEHPDDGKGEVVNGWSFLAFLKTGELVYKYNEKKIFTILGLSGISPIELRDILDTGEKYRRLLKNYVNQDPDNMLSMGRRNLKARFLAIDKEAGRNNH